VVSGGTMVAIDKLRNAPRTFVLSRISSAHLL
jgi:predicted DNA-binding transcriptional regulator YafY